MPPFWPFKKKEPVAQVQEKPPAPIVYKRGEHVGARGGIQTDSGAYKDALALFGGGSQEVEKATDQAVHYDGATSESSAERVGPADTGEADQAVEGDDTSTWVHHTDGYHYKRRPDGSFEPTPYTKSEDGRYSPYS